MQLVTRQECILSIIDKHFVKKLLAHLGGTEEILILLMTFNSLSFKYDTPKVGQYVMD